MTTITAESVFDQIKSLSGAERTKLFSLVADRAFSEEKTWYSHEEVFGDLKDEAFTSSDAALYLGVSLSTLRRMVKSGVLAPSDTIGRSQVFSLSDLRSYKASKTVTRH